MKKAAAPRGMEPREAGTTRQTERVHNESTSQNADWATSGRPHHSRVEAAPPPPAGQGRSVTNVLLPEHRALIDGSGISPAVESARGYYSEKTAAGLRRLGFTDKQARVPALVIPVWGVGGEIALYQSRPNSPRVNKQGKPLKYETPLGARMALDVPPPARRWVQDPKRPLIVTEGIRKADSAVSRDLACIALLGVWNWRGTNEHGGLTALADWEAIALKHRGVYIAFDSDVMRKPGVHAALIRLKPFLEGRGADVALIYLPSGNDGSKVGLDDFLVAGNGPDQLLALATTEVRAVPGAAAEVAYEKTAEGFVWNQPTQGGTVPRRLTTFLADIAAEIVNDDGIEVQRSYEIDASLNGRSARFQVAAARFAALSWAEEHLGPKAFIIPGFGLRDHAQAAIRSLSPAIAERRVFGHTGWRAVDGEWLFLHGAGAIGRGGNARGVQVDLPGPLSRFSLPDPPEGPALIDAVLASLSVLKVASLRITVPLLAAIYRGVLGGSDFSEHLVGPTGAGKSELCALVQRHFGQGMDRQHLPGSWASTGNALEALAFAAKDRVLCVDDFAPTGSSADVQRFHREADRVFRAAGNNAGRQRLRPDATLKAAKSPRGVILSSGEEIPRGQSLRARFLALEVGPDDVSWPEMSRCQKRAREGLYAQSLAAFLRWLAPQYPQIQARMRAEIDALREAAYQDGQHRRTPGIVADLALGIRYFLDFAVDVTALTKAQANEAWEAAWTALGEAAAAQAQHHAAAEPTGRFLELLSAAMRSGEAHVAAMDGGKPDSPASWGWRAIESGTGENEWRPQGKRVGWLDGEHLFLEPDASYAAAQEIGRKVGDGLAVTPRTLRKRLKERGLLQSVDAARGVLTVRRTVEGRRSDVLLLKAARVSTVAEPDQPDQERDEGAGDALAGQVPAVPWLGPERERINDPTTATPPRAPAPAVDRAVPQCDDGGVVGLVGSAIGTDAAGNETARDEGLNAVQDPTIDPTGNPTTDGAAQPQAPPAAPAGNMDQNRAGSGPAGRENTNPRLFGPDDAGGAGAEFRWGGI